MSSASPHDAALRLATVASLAGVITQDRCGIGPAWNRWAVQIFGHRATETAEQSIRLDVSLIVASLATAEGEIVGASKTGRVVGGRQSLEGGARYLVALIEPSVDAIISGGDQ